MSESKIGVPYPDDTSDASYPLIKLAGVDSWRTLAAQSNFCWVQFSEKGWRILPHRYRGPRLGFYTLPERAIVLDSAATDDELACAIHTALEIGAKLRLGESSYGASEE